MQRMAEFTVTGHGSFPVDMLRYDSCWPRTETMSAVLDASFRRGSATETFTVEMRGLQMPTDRRWESFGWKVTEAKFSPVGKWST